MNSVSSADGVTAPIKLARFPQVSIRDLASLAAAFALLCVFRYLHPISGISAHGQAVFGVFLWFIVVMVTNCVPRAIVGLTSPLLLVLFAHIPVPQAFNAFNTNIFFLATGAFLIAAVMMATPLGKRMALGAASCMKSSRAHKVLTGLFLAEVAVPILPVVNETALWLPICKGVESVASGDARNPQEAARFNTAVYYLIAGALPLFIGPLILTSNFPNLILVAALKSTMHIDVSWGQWFWLNLPLWGLLPLLLVYVIRHFRLDRIEMPGAEAGLAALRAELGPISWAEIWIVAVLAISVLLWFFAPIKSGMTALLAAFLLFLPVGGIQFDDINRHMLWDVLILLGGAISLGTALYHSGIVQWASTLIAEPLKTSHLPLWALLTVLVFAFHIPRAGIVSNVASATAFVPLAISLASTLHYNVLPFSLVLIDCMNYALFLPISVTAFLIAWSVSRTSAWEAIRFGVPLSVIANLYVLILEPLWLRAIGFPI
ncbi:MAG: hypothetical protein B7Z66_08915 [Chromatiales bacterium 21-64-14]|nr:MAG: hypothetical protein B7Z66_08915 [Chromatiales bacterium 21-64-14]HQU16097.1 SLC13 family permease [Gammaproteobacteria bacterium]